MNDNSTMDKIRILNSSVRTLLVVLFLGAFCYVAWLGYDRFVRPGFDAAQIRQDLEALQAKYDAQGKELERTRTALKLIKIDRRRATIEVTDTGSDADGTNPWFEVEFTEVDNKGLPLSAPRTFRLKGSMLYVDSWVVKFEDEYVEQADELRGGSLCIFKGIWGDIDEKENRFHSLDQPDSDTETAYGPLNNQSELEKKIWDDFWTIATDPKKQSELGIRGNHGQVNYLPVKPGLTYEVNLRASDGLTIKVSGENNT